eukprot:jgi/Bigna1/69373/fgenesh1_pg.8_\
MTTTSPPHLYDAVVIGAGAAGIGAGVALEESGIKNYVILEARDRIGGRAFTTEEFGYPLDMGGQWIHNSCYQNPMWLYARKYGVLNHVAKPVVSKDKTAAAGEIGAKRSPQPPGRWLVDMKDGGLIPYSKIRKTSNAFGHKFHAELEKHYDIDSDNDSSDDTNDVEDVPLSVIVTDALAQVLIVPCWQRSLTLIFTPQAKIRSLDTKGRQYLGIEEKLCCKYDRIVNAVEGIEEYEGAEVGDLSAYFFNYDTGTMPGINSNLRCGYGGLVLRIAKEKKLIIEKGVQVASIRTVMREDCKIDDEFPMMDFFPKENIAAAAAVVSNDENISCTKCGCDRDVNHIDKRKVNIDTAASTITITHSYSPNDGDKEEAKEGCEKSSPLSPSITIVTSTEGKKYYTKSVIIALPLGVVKHGGIDILPKLPPRVAKALKYIEAGFYNKVALEFEGEIAWTKSATATSALDKLDTSNLEALTDDHDDNDNHDGLGDNDDIIFRFLRFTNWKAYSGRHVWLGYTTVSYSKQMRTMSDEEILEDALDVFRKSLQRQAEGQNNDKNDGKMVLLPKLKRYRIANWGKDPLSLGSWSYIKVGGKASLKSLLMYTMGMGQLQ